MNVVEIIAKKRDGHALTRSEIDYFVAGIANGDVADYQAAAWCMAVYLNGMSRQETAALTLAMAASGDQLDLHDTLSYIVDKHSSGGVGDKTTLVVLPLVAAFGIPVAKMSGRGLGFTGGTLDKMESISGWRSDLSLPQFKRQVSEIGLALAGQTAALAPADGKLYGLRDVTATVGSMPLIAASIMSKKLAAGSDGIVLDVKVGSGAFLKDAEEGRVLAQTMVDIGQDAGRDVVALLSDMNQPLGFAAGNALEVKEAILTLQNDPAAPADFWEHCLAIATQMVMLAQPETGQDRAEIEKGLSDVRQSGLAFEKFKAMVAAQGGDLAEVEQLDKLPSAPLIKALPAPSSGYLAAIDTAALGWMIVGMGGGRRQKTDQIDPRVGFHLPFKIGDQVTAGEPLAQLHAADQQGYDQAAVAFLAALTMSEEPPQPPPHFYGEISSRR